MDPRLKAIQDLLAVFNTLPEGVQLNLAKYFIGLIDLVQQSKHFEVAAPAQPRKP